MPNNLRLPLAGISIADISRNDSTLYFITFQTNITIKMQWKSFTFMVQQYPLINAVFYYQKKTNECVEGKNFRF